MRSVAGRPRRAGDVVDPRPRRLFRFGPWFRRGRLGWSGRDAAGDPLAVDHNDRCCHPCMTEESEPGRGCSSDVRGIDGFATDVWCLCYRGVADSASIGYLSRMRRSTGHVCRISRGGPSSAARIGLRTTARPGPHPGIPAHRIVEISRSVFTTAGHRTLSFLTPYTNPHVARAEVPPIRPTSSKNATTPTTTTEKAEGDAPRDLIRGPQTCTFTPHCRIRP